jgi:hypothetical protein
MERLGWGLYFIVAVLGLFLLPGFVYALWVWFDLAWYWGGAILIGLLTLGRVTNIVVFIVGLCGIYLFLVSG